MATRRKLSEVPPFLAIERAIGNAILGALVTLIVGGVVSMITLYARVAVLAESQIRTQAQFEEHLRNSVAKDQYEKRDASIQKQLNDKATKDDLAELRAEVKEEIADLKDVVHTLNEALTVRRK